MQERDNARMSVGMHVVDGSMSVITNDIDTKFVKYLQDVTQKVLGGEISKEKAVRMIVSETYAQLHTSCSVCHKTIEDDEEVAHKYIDPVTDQMPTPELWNDGSSYVPQRYRHAYHPSFTNTELGYSVEENERMKKAFSGEGRMMKFYASRSKDVI